MDYSYLMITLWHAKSGAFEAERQSINDLFRGGKFRNEARRRIERELDPPSNQRGGG